MSVRATLALVAVLAASSAAAAEPTASSRSRVPSPAPVADETPAQTTLGLRLGTDGGVGAEADLTFDRIAAGLPFSARLAAGHRWGDAGSPLDARHVFINANDNGVPEENGRRWDFRVDAMWQPGWMPNLWLYGGPRFSMFTANFKFVGGNEFFDVTTNQWGAGTGAEWRYPMGSRTSLTIATGLDYYANAGFTGHDTTYNPDGTAVSPVDDYTYASADAAIHQPKWAPRFAVGLGYRLGR